MGSWGVGLYQNDVGLDVQGTYRDCRKMGFRGGALAAIVREGAGIGDSPEGEDEIVGYLALADLLWKDGALPAAMRDTALRLIADQLQRPRLPSDPPPTLPSPSRGEGILLQRWEDARDRKKQAALLAALAKRLASPQPAKAAPAKPPYVEQCDFGIGEIIAYPHPAGAWTLLRVIAYWTRFRGRSPICEVLDREPGAIPAPGELAGIAFKKRVGQPIWGAAKPAEQLAFLIAEGRLPPGATWADYEDQMIAPHIPIIRRSERDPHFHLVKRLGASVPSQRPFLGDWWVPRNAWTTWKDLPMRLEEYFGEIEEYREE
jgi:hypothetical protein